jgi:hypothetical protein
MKYLKYLSFAAAVMLLTTYATDISYKMGINHGAIKCQGTLSSLFGAMFGEDIGKQVSSMPVDLPYENPFKFWEREPYE